MATAAAHHEPCPWCGNQISRAKFLEIETRIRADEKRRFDAAEAEMRAKLAAERELFETKHKADTSSLELQLLAARETIEKANEAQADFDRKLEAATSNAALVERKKIETELAQKHQAELERARELIKADFIKQKVKDDFENQKATKVLQNKLAELTKKLEEQAAAKPEVVDIDVVEELKAAFKGDRVLKLPKDKADSGGDVLIEVKYKNAVCGKILVDSRIRGNWQTSYATKLRSDMADQVADHAILATVHFPRGASELHRHDDDVLLVHPGRVVEIVGILRAALVRMFRNKLTSEERAEKKLKIYDHITSDVFRRKLANTGKLAQEVLDLDAEEVEQHQRIWKKRGGIMTKLQTASNAVADEINAIVDGIKDD